MDKKKEKAFGFIRKYSFLILDFLLLAFIFQVSYLAHKSVSLVILLILFEVFSRTKLSEKIFDRFNLPLFMLSTVISVIPLYAFYLIVFPKLPDFVTRFTVPILIIDLIFFATAIFFALSFVIKKKKGLGFKVFKSFLAGLALSFLIIIYLPLDSYIGNITNFEFPIQEFIFYQMFFCIAVACLITALIFFIPDKAYNVVYAILLGIAVALFVQYAFLNGKLTLLGVSNDSVQVSTGTKIVNLIIWVLIIAAVSVLVLLIKKKQDKVDVFCFAIYLAFHIVSCILLISLAPSEIYGITTQYYFDSSEIYTVSKNQNVIVIVFDCFDNQYVAPYYEENPGSFEGLKDFTLYTNTCSVYDSTVTSMSQMFGGAEFDNTLSKDEWFDTYWNSDKTVKFYELLHDSNYTCNGYNFEMPEKQYLYGKFDNLKKYDEPKKLELDDFDYEKFRLDFGKLALLRCLPYAGKTLVKFDGLSFRDIAMYKLSTEAYYMNSDYLNHLQLCLSEDDKNYLMINHINGAHKPCTVEEGVSSSFDIMNEMVNQLKQLGVYDNSTIIFTADHGFHNEEAPDEYGATPLFMIKAPYETHDHIVFTSTPEYHEDMMGTIAYFTGIDQKVGPKFFGNTIYDFNEDSVRTRVWYDRMYDEDSPAIYSTGRLSYTTIYNAYCKYEFTGDSSCLYGKEPGSEGTEIYPMTEYFG